MISTVGPERESIRTIDETVPAFTGQRLPTTSGFDGDSSIFS
jgi:hypothetical protein